MDNQQFANFLKVQEKILNILNQINKNQIDMMYLIKRAKFGSNTDIAYCKECDRNVAIEGMGQFARCIHCADIIKTKFNE